MENKQIPLLDVKGLKKYYPIRDGIIPRKIGNVYAVDGVDFRIHSGETLGLVGESGCGKSTIGRQIVSLEQPTAGEIWYNGQLLNHKAGKEMNKIRTRIQMIFQDPYSSLNPRKKIKDMLVAPMLYHGFCTKHSAEHEVNKLLEMVGLPQKAKERYPHEFSGGQRQRIGIARALSLRPSLIICDEPVSALDVSIQAQILNLLRELQKEMNLTYLFIGHGLDAVNYISNRIAVMYLGKIVEIADAKELFQHPIHPYTRALCNAAPIPDPDMRDRKRTIIEGELPSNTIIHKGCRFHTRCSYVTEQCKMVEPILNPIYQDSTHLAACPVMSESLMKKELLASSYSEQVMSSNQNIDDIGK